MKKLFSVLVAALFAVAINAGELVVDLTKAASSGSEGCSGVPTVTDGVLDVEWNVVTNWAVGGVEFSLPNVTNVSKINFELKGDGQAITFYVYLVDANGGLKWEDEHWISLESTEWEAIELLPNADLWGNHGEEPWQKLVMVANPATASNGKFSIKDLKITCDYATVAKPETAPAVPNHDVADVMAMYCNHYETNNLNFYVLGWGGVLTWESLDLDGTNVLYCQDMKWEMMTNWDSNAYDFSEFEKFHFDVWVPEERWLKVTFEALKVADGGRADWKNGITFKLNAGWNTIDADPAWWISEEAPYDWKDVRYIAFEGYKNVDAETFDECSSAEGTPFAFTNLYWWKSPAVEYPAAPANPKIDEDGVMALFSPAYATNNVNFEPTSWGTAWDNVDGKFFYTASMGWDCFTNWGADHYDMNAYDMFHADIYVTVDSKIKITFEALGAGDGGTGWKNGAFVELKANKWNHVDVDLLNAPFQDYEFKDVRYLVLEAFQLPDGASAEGTPLGIANAFFYDSSFAGVEDVTVDKVAVKRIVNGQVVIEKNGVQYSVLGTQF